MNPLATYAREIRTIVATGFIPGCNPLALIQMPYPNKGLSKLRKNRIAVPGARYFVTAVIRERKSGLACWPIWAKLLESTCREEADIWAIVVMPDHMHALFVLPPETTPGTVVRALKGPTSVVLRGLQQAWQKNYFEHRLRPEEESEPYLRYMLSNPYRAKLITLEERWPFWAITSPQAKWFLEKYPKQCPEAQWLKLDKPWVDHAS